MPTKDKRTATGTRDTSPVARYITMLEETAHVTFERGKPVTDLRAFAKRVKPHFGEIAWTPPPSYARTLETWGPIAATRNVAAIDDDVGFKLLGGTALKETNEDLVHMPEGVSIDDGVDLSTNHLVGFAEASGEGIWCFDVTANDGEYPVYYHHQDEPRARVLATGKWNDPRDATPDFESFTQWLETMTAALVAKKAPKWLEDLGEPGMTFTRKRLTLP